MSKTLPPIIQALENPRRSAFPSNISDPDSMLSLAGRQAVQRVLADCPVEVAMVLLRSLHGARADSSMMLRAACEVFDRWGIGNRQRKDGVLYMLALTERKHHLQVGRGLLNRFGEAARQAVLEAAVPALREGDADMAALLIARQINWRLRWGWKIERAFIVLIVSTCIVRASWWLFGGMWRRWVSKQRAEEERQRRLQRLHEAWGRLSNAGTSGFHSHCVICIEPLSRKAEDWLVELTLQRRGFLAPKPSSSHNWLCTLVRLPPGLQRHVLAFAGPTLEDFTTSVLRTGAARAQGVEIFRCSHVFHEDCSERWLQSNNTCPTCRMPDPRLVSAAAVASVFGVAQLNSAAVDFPSAMDSFGDVFEAVSADRLQRYTHHPAQQQPALERGTWARFQDVAETASGFGFGGGDSAGGAGTTGDW